MSEEVLDTAPATADTAPETTTEAPLDTTTETAQPTFRDAFKTRVGDEAFKSFEKYGDDESLANGILSAQQMIGRKGDIPKADADIAEMAPFWNKLGAGELNVSIPELGEEFGDSKGGLTEYYGGLKDQIVEFAKEVIPNSRNMSEIISGVMSKFIEGDSKATLEGEMENRKAQEASLATVASKVGLSVDALKQTNEEVIKKYGWSNETSFAEILHTLAKETANTNTLNDATMNNTGEGLQAQIDDEMATPEYLNDGPNHKKSVEKVMGLLKRQAELLEKG